jgi:hypothetical protein
LNDDLTERLITLGKVLEEQWLLDAAHELERLRDVIDRAAKAWLALEPPVVWEGDVGDAMGAAVKEIERLRGVAREDRPEWYSDPNWVYPDR